MLGGVNRPHGGAKDRVIVAFHLEGGLVAVEGDEAAHGDGALGDEALHRR